MLNVVRLDRNRDIEANEVHGQFATEAEYATCNCERMAGFAIVTWDDEGCIQVAHHVGAMTPLPVAMIPSIVKDYMTITFAGK